MIGDLISDIFCHCMGIWVAYQVGDTYNQVIYNPNIPKNIGNMLIILAFFVIFIDCNILIML